MDKRRTHVTVTSIYEERGFAWGAEDNGQAVYMGSNIVMTVPLHLGKRLDAWVLHTDGYEDPQVQRLASDEDAAPATALADEEPGSAGVNVEAMRPTYDSLRQIRNDAATAANNADKMLLEVIEKWGKPAGWHYTKIPT